jgi:hypothetical protein
MSAIVVPSGMLRISRQGEADRVVYPVHADGWRQLGWTVHPPEFELEEDNEEPRELEVEADELLADELGVDGTGLAADAGDGVGDSDAEPVAVAELSGSGTSGDSGGGGEPAGDVGSEPPIAVPAFEGMTKAEIIATVSEHYGVMLDSSQTKAELVAAAQALAAEVAAAPGGAEPEGGDEGGNDAEDLVTGGSDEPAVPELLL